MNDLNKFREDTKKWLDENCPPSMRSGADSNICLLYTSDAADEP